MLAEIRMDHGFHGFHGWPSFIRVIRVIRGPLSDHRDHSFPGQCGLFEVQEKSHFQTCDVMTGFTNVPMVLSVLSVQSVVKENRRGPRRFRPILIDYKSALRASAAR